MPRVVVPLMAAYLLIAASCTGATTEATQSAPVRAADHLLSAPSTTVSVEAPREAPSYRETGTASWYGGELQGRKTASGEIFDMYGMTAAHRTLPFGTVLRVTNLENSRSITVKVNDRGPFVRDRAIDVSYGAARELGFVSQGTATVRFEAVAPVDLAGAFTVQAAVFAEEENAKILRDRLQRKYETVVIVPFESNEGKFFRVRVGAYGSREKAERIAGKLILDGLEPMVVRKD